jgi:hypothetical protein
LSLHRDSDPTFQAGCPLPSSPPGFIAWLVGGSFESNHKGGDAFRREGGLAKAGAAGAQGGRVLTGARPPLETHCRACEGGQMPLSSAVPLRRGASLMQPPKAYRRACRPKPQTQSPAPEISTNGGAALERAVPKGKLYIELSPAEKLTVGRVCRSLEPNPEGGDIHKRRERQRGGRGDCDDRLVDTGWEGAAGAGSPGAAHAHGEGGAPSFACGGRVGEGEAEGGLWKG